MDKANKIMVLAYYSVILATSIKNVKLCSGFKEEGLDKDKENPHFVAFEKASKIEEVIEMSDEQRTMPRYLKLRSEMRLIAQDEIIKTVRHQRHPAGDLNDNKENVPNVTYQNCLGFENKTQIRNKSALDSTPSPMIV